MYKNKNDKPFVSTEEESNSIILMGPKEELTYFKALVEKLDVDRQQVYVQARIIEISERKTKDVGIKYGINGFARGRLGLVNFGSTLTGADNALSLSTLGDYGVGLSSVKNALSLGVSINLLNENGAADIVSEPSLLCINNKSSSIYVGETISIKTGTTTTVGGVPTDTYKREDVGLTLKVKPRISNGNKVLLEIVTKLEDVGQTSTNSNPNTSKKELETTAIVNNGESIILGGYIKEKKEHTVQKVPFFGDIPLIGSLFRNKREVSDKINLVIIITPYIVPKSKDLTFVRNQLTQLKLLEDKYTKDTILRLKKEKLNAKKQDNERAEETKIIDEEFEALTTKVKTKPTTNQQLHNQRIKEMFGI